VADGQQRLLGALGGLRDQSRDERRLVGGNGLERLAGPLLDERLSLGLLLAGRHLLHERVVLLTQLGDLRVAAGFLLHALRCFGAARVVLACLGQRERRAADKLPIVFGLDAELAKGCNGVALDELRQLLGGTVLRRQLLLLSRASSVRCSCISCSKARFAATARRGTSWPACRWPRAPSWSWRRVPRPWALRSWLRPWARRRARFASTGSGFASTGFASTTGFSAGGGISDGSAAARALPTLTSFAARASRAATTGFTFAAASTGAAGAGTAPTRTSPMCMVMTYIQLSCKLSAMHLRLTYDASVSEPGGFRTEPSGGSIWCSTKRADELRRAGISAVSIDGCGVRCSPPSPSRPSSPTSRTSRRRMACLRSTTPPPTPTALSPALSSNA
jgi:hypothetical protein